MKQERQIAVVICRYLRGGIKYIRLVRLTPYVRKYLRISLARDKERRSDYYYPRDDGSIVAIYQ